MASLLTPYDRCPPVVLRALVVWLLHVADLGDVSSLLLAAPAHLSYQYPCTVTSSLVGCRYRLMVRRVMEGSRKFGMAVALRTLDGGTELHHVATEAEITECTPQTDGRFYLEIKVGLADWIGDRCRRMMSPVRQEGRGDK